LSTGELLNEAKVFKDEIIKAQVLEDEITKTQSVCLDIPLASHGKEI